MNIVPKIIFFSTLTNKEAFFSLKKKKPTNTNEGVFCFVKKRKTSMSQEHEELKWSPELQLVSEEILKLKADTWSSIAWKMAIREVQEFDERAEKQEKEKLASAGVHKRRMHVMNSGGGRNRKDPAILRPGTSYFCRVQERQGVILNSPLLASSQSLCKQYSEVARELGLFRSEYIQLKTRLENALKSEPVGIEKTPEVQELYEVLANYYWVFLNEPLSLALERRIMSYLAELKLRRQQESESHEQQQ